MPETAIHKDGHFLLGENEVRAPKYFCVAPPASYPRFAKKSQQNKFRRFVPARAHRRHDSRPFLFAESIRHRVNSADALKRKKEKRTALNRPLLRASVVSSGRIR
jgi:hypothetical protein